MPVRHLPASNSEVLPLKNKNSFAVRSTPSVNADFMCYVNVLEHTPFSMLLNVYPIYSYHELLYYIPHNKNWGSCQPGNLQNPVVFHMMHSISGDTAESAGRSE